jgi:diaminopimelate decarboxylase
MASLPIYEPPALRIHKAGLTNKVGAPAARAQDRVANVPVEELVAAYGSPLFVYDEHAMVERTRELRDALAVRWPRVELAWSYKTCYLDAVCRVFHREGSWAEVVSAMEYEKAVRNGVPEHRILWNGPHKKEADLRRAFRGGARVHIDNWDEVALAEKVARELGLRPRVAIRVNMQAGLVPRWGRFGFALEGGQAWDAARRIAGGGVLELAGLHTHIGTFILDPGAYREAAAKLAGLANRMRTELGLHLAWIDLGGGMASSARLKAQYLPSEQVTPSLGQYAEAITDGLSLLETHEDDAPALFVEAGRALIDDAGTLVSTVVANKRLPEGLRSVVLDAGVNLLFTSWWYRHQIVPCQEPRGLPEPTVFYGPLCMNVDVVCEAVSMPPIPVGGRVLISPVGAYNVTQSMQFIELRPAVAMVRRDGTHALIRRAEGLDDLVGPEVVPEWLRAS